MADESRSPAHRRQAVDAGSLLQVLRDLSPEARKELISFLRSGALPVPADDGLTLVRVADLLERLLT